MMQLRISNHLTRYLFSMPLVLHGWWLVFKLPHTLRMLYEAFRPGGLNVPDSEFWAFGATDARFRPWYSKITADYHRQGRFGFVWTDGLGLALGARIYNNFATYWMLHRLGARGTMRLGFPLMLFFIALFSGWAFGPWVAILFTLLAAGSPLMVSTYTHLGKPEILWWGLAVPFTVLALLETSLAAGLLWSFLALVNLPISVMLALFLGPELLYLSLANNTLPLLFVAVLPGAIKHLIRFIYMWRSGFVGGLVQEQSRVARSSLLPATSDLVWWLPFALSVVVTSITTGLWILGGLLLLTGILLDWVNNRWLYFNDPQSIHMSFWIISFSFAVVFGSLPGLLLLLLLAYNQPKLFDPTRPNPKNYAHKWQYRLDWTRRLAAEYPELHPITLPQPELLMDFFALIKNGSRVITEVDGDLRTGSQFRHFWLWTEEFLPSRGIELVNETYTRLNDAELVDNYLNCFSSASFDGVQMDRICGLLGVSYVVTLSEATRETLEKAGYECIAQVDLGVLHDFRNILSVPPASLTLLQRPEPTTMIDPYVHWQIDRNTIKWQAAANTTYTVRYQYHPDFTAIQGERSLAVHPAPAFPELKLQFMQVQTEAGGEVRLTFQPRFI